MLLRVDVVGIVAISNNSKINACYNSGNIESTNSNIGGIVGSAIDGPVISNSFNNATISALETAGGIVGNNSEARMIVKYCYNTGDIYSSSGGIVGAIVGAIINSKNISNCEWCTKSVSYGIGYINSNNGAIYNENIDMKNILLVVNSDRAFIADTNNINNGYPILAWQ